MLIKKTLISKCVPLLEMVPVFIFINDSISYLFGIIKIIIFVNNTLI